MSSRNISVLLIVGVIVVTILFSSLFIVKQTEQAIVLQFGQPKKIHLEPGLKVKVPFIQDVMFFDKRLLNFDATQPTELIMGDTKRVVIDTITRYRIVDPLLFYQKVPGGELKLRAQLQTFVNGTLLSVLGQYGLDDLLSPKRSQIIDEISKTVHNKAKEFGVEVVDVLIKRADLPPENTDAILRRMEKERERIARQFRAEGEREGQEIRSLAERTRTVIIAEAHKKSSIIRGQGDKAASTVYATAFKVDPEFYTFYRSMEAYKSAFGDDTQYVISPNNDFFKYLKQGPKKLDKGIDKNPLGTQEIEKVIQQIETIVEDNVLSTDVILEVPPAEEQEGVNPTKSE